MTIDELKKFVEFIARKSQAGGNPTPSQFNIDVERSFMEWVMKRYGNPQEYQPGAPIPRVAWQDTKKITDDLRFLLARHEFQVPVNGRLPVPDGTTTDLQGNVAEAYLHGSSLRREVIKKKGDELVVNETTIDELRDSEVGSRLSSQIFKDSNACAFYNDYIQFYPKNIGKVIFTYLRTPKKPYWGSTLSNNRPVYDPSTSVDVESPDITHNEIAMGVLGFLGISIREQQLQVYADQMKKEGI